MLSFEMMESGCFYEVDSSYSWEDWINSGDAGSEDFEVGRGAVTWLVWNEILYYSDGSSPVLPEDLIADYVNDSGGSGGGGSDPDPEPLASGEPNGYIGINGKARKFTDVYIGVNGKARKIKKIYIGVNGKARLCWEYPEATPQTFTFTFEGREYTAPINITWGSFVGSDYGLGDWEWRRDILYHIPSSLYIEDIIPTHIVYETVSLLGV